MFGTVRQAMKKILKLGCVCCSFFPFPPNFTQCTANSFLLFFYPSLWCGGSRGWNYWHCYCKGAVIALSWAQSSPPGKRSKFGYVFLCTRNSLLFVKYVSTHIGLHQSSHNSGVIHSGLYYQPGSKRAKLCVAGAAKMYRYLKERNIPHAVCGKVSSIWNFTQGSVY